jgi:hypothetical protein
MVRQEPKATRVMPSPPEARAIPVMPPRPATPKAKRLVTGSTATKTTARTPRPTRSAKPRPQGDDDEDAQQQPSGISFDSVPSRNLSEP